MVTVGRPVARAFDNGLTLEVTRLCVLPGLPVVVDSKGEEHAAPVASMLYRAAWRVTSGLGYRRLVTYTLKSEPGTSMRASGWKMLYETRDGREWNAPSRPRVNKHPKGAKTLWELEC